MDKDRSLKLFTHFSQEDLLKIFTLEQLKYMYKVYVDSVSEINDIEILAKYLDTRIPRTAGQGLLCMQGDLVLDIDGNILRILKLDYVDERLGSLPLVFDLKARTKYATLSFLIKIPEFIFANDISNQLKAELVIKAKGQNYLILDENTYVLGSFYVIDEKMVKAILNRGQFTFMLSTYPNDDPD